MSAALDSGLEVTALHNHFFGDSRTLDPEKLDEVFA